MSSTEDIPDDNVRSFPRTLTDAFKEEAYQPIEDVTTGFRRPARLEPRRETFLRRLLAPLLIPTIAKPRSKTK